MLSAVPDQAYKEVDHRLAAIVPEQFCVWPCSEGRELLLSPVRSSELRSRPVTCGCQRLEYVVSRIGDHPTICLSPRAGEGCLPVRRSNDSFEARASLRMQNHAREISAMSRAKALPPSRDKHGRQPRAHSYARKVHAPESREHNFPGHETITAIRGGYCTVRIAIQRLTACYARPTGNFGLGGTAVPRSGANVGAARARKAQTGQAQA